MNVVNVDMTKFLQYVASSDKSGRVASKYYKYFGVTFE